ncbi:MAG TPA: lysophospholipid acyltransferase family protein [Polyangiaceae bacterium]|nr:lysophospholipid acyltransferase family protein [Polyangiaceae bacterium]
MWAVGLRRCARWGAQRGPAWWLEYSPGPIAMLAGVLASKQRHRATALMEWLGQPKGASWQLLRNYGHCLAESFATQRPASVEVIGREHLPDASARGVVLATAHTGAWEVAAGALHQEHGIAVRLGLEPEVHPGVWALHEASRRERGLEGIALEASPASALALLNQVQGGGLVALQVDRPGHSKRTLSSVLLGRQLALAEGPFRIAKLAGAPLVPVFNARLGFLRYQIEVFPAIHIPANATPAQLLSAAQRVTDCFEIFLRRFPTQWFHFVDSPLAPRITSSVESLPVRQ